MDDKITFNDQQVFLPKYPDNLTIQLKKKFDEIDKLLFEAVFTNFYMGKKNVYLVMWKKGEAVGGFRWVEPPISYRELEKQTGRERHDLKKWHDIFKNNTWEQWEEASK